MKTIAYIRVSTSTQNTNNQRLAILDFAQKEGLKVDEFIEVSISSRRPEQHKQLNTAINQLKKNDVNR